MLMIEHYQIKNAGKTNRDRHKYIRKYLVINGKY